MPTYRLTPAARRDLERIWTYLEGLLSLHDTIARIDVIESACDRLCAMPRICRERAEFSPPVRIYPIDRFLIVYIIVDDDIDIVRILGAGMDLHGQLAPDS